MTATSWPEVRLGDVAIAFQDGPFGSNLKSEHYVEAGVRVVRLQNIGPGSFIDVDRAFVTEEHFARLRKHECLPGDVLIATLGDPIVRACVQPSSIPVALNKADCLRMRCDPNRAVPEYVAGCLNSGLFQARLAALAHGQTRPRVNLRQVRDAQIPLPPVGEQRRIASVLNQADALRVQRQGSVSLLGSITDGYFLSAFGDPARNERSHPILPLGDVASRFADGPFGSSLKSSHYVDEPGVRVVRLQNIGTGEFIDDDAAFISEAHFDRLRVHECRPGDVLVGTMGDPNLRACVQPAWLDRALNKADCVQIRPDPMVATATWLSGLLNLPSTCRMASGLIRGQTRARLSMGRLRSMLVPVPPLADQHAFAERVDEVRRQRARLERSAERLDELFASLQQRAFRGDL